MTYSDMISAIDTGVTYSNRGRKGYKKANEKWTISISTNRQARTLTTYLKTEELGHNWIESELAQFKRVIDHHNKRYDDDEVIVSYKVERIDRMGKEYSEYITYSTEPRI